MTLEFLGQVQVFFGANRFVGYPAAVALVKNSEKIKMTPVQVRECLAMLESEEFSFGSDIFENISSPLDLLCTITQAFLNTCPDNDLELERGVTNGNDYYISVPYLEPNAAIISLKASLGISNDVLKLSAIKNIATTEFEIALSQAIKSVNHALDLVRYFSPNFDTAVLINAAKKQGIPVRLIDAHKKTWLFGMGSSSHLFFNGVSNENDCAGGAALTNDKFGTNGLISSLGFPTPRGALVRDLQSAKNVAASIGYPVVLKPNNLSQGGRCHRRH